MSLTMGTGPFGPQRDGSFNFDTSVLQPHTLYMENCPKRVRAELAGEVIADSRQAKILYETGHLPVYYFPPDDVRMDLLLPTDHTTHCPFKGDATYWSIQTADRVADNAIWSYPEPLDETPPLADHLAFYHGQMDGWYEEDERIMGHPHDPYHRVDVLQSSRHVRVEIGGDVIAESERPKLLFETSLPTRYYLPPEDVRIDLLAPSATKTVCPYKGRGSHWSVNVGREQLPDAAWSYPEPLPEATAVRDFFCFYGDKATIEVDGQRIG